MMRSEAQEVCERENSVKMIEFKSWKLAEIVLKNESTWSKKTRKLYLLNKLDLLKYFPKSKDFSISNLFQMNYI